MTPVKKRMQAVAAAMAIGLVGGAEAATISVTNSTAVAGPRISSGNLSTTISNWDLNGGNAVVLLFAAENGVNVAAKYGTEDMTVVESFDNDRHVASIAYIINPIATSADILLTADRPASRISHAYAIFSLDNVGAFADSDTRTSNGNLAYTTTEDGGYVFVAAENNSFNGGTLPSVSGNPDQVIFSQAVDGNQSTTFAHGDVPTAGSFTSSVSGNIETAALVAFDPVPEPGSLALMGLGGLLIARRRRG